MPTGLDNQPGCCPTCGTNRFYRHDLVVKGDRHIRVSVWDDRTASVWEESLEWEVADAEFGSWVCANDHPVSDEKTDFLDLVADQGIRTIPVDLL